MFGAFQGLVLGSWCMGLSRGYSGVFGAFQGLVLGAWGFPGAILGLRWDQDLSEGPVGTLGELSRGVEGEEGCARSSPSGV